MSPNVSVGGNRLGPVRGGLLALVLGAAVAGFGAYDYVQQSEAVADAVEVEATITDVGVERDTTGSQTGVDYEPRIEFEYDYQGTTYTGDDLYPAITSSEYDTRSAAESVVEPYEEGDVVTAYVDPDAPDAGFLERETSNDPLLFAGFGGLFVLVGGASIVRSYLW